MSHDDTGHNDRFLQSLEDSRRFMLDLMQENERLRTGNLELKQRVTDLEAKLKKQPAAPMPAPDAIEKDYRRLSTELAQMREELQAVEHENREFADSFVAIEQRNSTLANLYVASYQLHSTLDFDQVVGYVKEIIVNLVGSEKFGIYVLRENPKRLNLIAHEGLDVEKNHTLPIAGLVDTALTSNRTATSPDPLAPKNNQPVACIPLTIHGQTIGIIAIFALLHQKAELSDLDREIFDLLAGQAATALYSAQLFQQSKRKLNTLEGFLGLLRNG